MFSGMVNLGWGGWKGGLNSRTIEVERLIFGMRVTELDVGT